jgi:hypothetical protein
MAPVGPAASMPIARMHSAVRVQAMEGPEFRKLSDKDMDAIIFKV